MRPKVDEEKIAAWWNQVKANESWNALFVCLSWDNLRNGTKDDLREIYKVAVKQKISS